MFKRSVLLLSSLLLWGCGTDATTTADDFFTADVWVDRADAYVKDVGSPDAAAGSDTSGQDSACVPDCDGKACGDDGCGGSCGTCTGGLTCAPAGYCTNAGCVPDCDGKQCGFDGCGGQCGKCGVGEVCTDQLTCEPTNPGCGGVPTSGACDGTTLKWCEAGQIFTATCAATQGLVCGWSVEGQKYDCIPGTCTPACEGKGCGPDGCGGKCGICPAGESCTPAGVCEANCVAQCAGKQCGSNGCGGTCGTCPQGQVCGSGGACQAGTCVPDCAGKGCGPDGCGGKCGICPAGQSCTAAGVCEAGGCDPDCGGKQCGADGCGGSCGQCPQGLTCGAGFQCQAEPCTPSCGNKLCGDDGCGGICGACAEGWSCSPQGVCQPGGCTPQCAGKQCGPDGCGGSCGVCPLGSSCNANGACADGSGCVPQCAGKDCGPNGCGGTCGTCGPGTTCDGFGLCAPDGSGGDCGDLDYVGVCEGDVLRYCGGTSLQVVDCAASGLQCGFDAGNAWYDCVDEACQPNCAGKAAGAPDGCGGQCPGAGGCGDVDTSGQCDGDVLSYCAGGSLTTVDCAAQGQSCAYDEAFGWYDCLDEGCVPSCEGKVCGGDGCGGTCGSCGAGQTCDASGQCVDAGGCGDVSADGECDGDVLSYCAGGSLTTVDCASLGKACGYDDTFDWYDCIEDAGCVPSCEGKVCGGDGCGGTCGACTGGQVCQAGQCETPSGCGDVTSEGECDGTVLSYCAGGELSTADCASLGKVCGWDPTFEWYDCVDDAACVPSCDGKVCGGDGCGGTCGTCLAGEVCEGGQCQIEGCGDVTSDGKCAGDVLTYCAGGDLVTTACAASGKVCGYDDTFDWYDCIEPGCTPNCGGKDCGDDGCGGTCGTCPTGQTCSAGQCEASGGGCGDVTSDGECDGDVLSYCSGGNRVVSDCAALGKACGYDATFDWYDCIEPACTPNCGGKDCGDDGCGGTCGSCGSDESCDAGQCVSVDPCGGLDIAGTCEGNTLKYCAGGELYTTDCTSSGMVCAYEQTYEWYDCVSP